ncbi:hypothetical protein JQR85_16935 [Stutzerimonas urumqiensis]|uniref:hypothetical protein n=1 Tax=Stutzerimonas urumqiensis TaxID=638269 RepID=UPI000EB24313|nr:hypothetical protein [Stutzerimonas urumqiensis]
MTAADLTREQLLAHPDAQDCTLYRPDPRDADAEELDLGDGKVLLLGPFEPPSEWDAAERDAFFEDAEPGAFQRARIALDRPGAAAPEVGDYLALSLANGEVQMHFIHDQAADGSFVLLHESLDLD